MARLQTCINFKSPIVEYGLKWIDRHDQCCSSINGEREIVQSSARMLTKGAENKAEAITLHVARNSFRPLKRVFLPACFSPSSTRLDATRGIEIYTRKTRGAVRTSWRDVENTRNDSSSTIHPRQEPK